MIQALTLTVPVPLPELARECQLLQSWIFGCEMVARALRFVPDTEAALEVYASSAAACVPCRCVTQTQAGDIAEQVWAHVRGEGQA